MLINKVTMYLTLLAIQNYETMTVLCLNPVDSVNYVKQEASNQASTNERFLPTCSSYDSTQTEYINDSEKYDVSMMKIICKIKSSNSISLHNVPGLIEKESMKINQLSHQNFEEKNYKKFTQGKCIDKCNHKEASTLTSMLVTPNDEEHFTSNRSKLKRIERHSVLNHLKNIKLNENFNNLNIDKFIGKNNNRIRRQIRFIPKLMSKNNQKLLSKKTNFDSSFIRSLVGVFDNQHPSVISNFQRIKPNQVIIAPTRYIDDAKIINAAVPHGFYTTEKSIETEDPQFVKNILRNPNGFGESERVFPTENVKENVDRSQVLQIHHFLPTVKPIKIPKIPNKHPVNNNYEVYEEIQHDNHKVDPFEKSILSTPKNLHSKIPTVVERESYKYHGKDTKYEDHYTGTYSFNYDVDDEKSGNDFGHHETRSQHQTNGNYHVRLPDGRLQKVQYHADENGYHADVSYESYHKFHEK